MKLLSLQLIAIAALGQGLPLEKSIRPVTVAAKRALIIGNGNYQSQDRIPQSLNDADDMDATLRGLGFVTTVRKDLTLDGLNRELRAFIRTIKSNDLALVYYSGHGGMVDGENYLLPVNFERPDLPREVEQRAFRMSYLKKDLEDSGARVRVLIFDACRNNSLVGEKSGGGGGLAAMRGQPEGTLIAYASDEGQPARYSPTARNSYYTQALRAHLAEGGVHLKEALERTQLQVFSDTARTQRPYLYGFLTGPVYLNGPAPEVRVTPVDTCARAWRMIENSADANAVKTFTQDFGECTQEVRLAKLKLTTLERRVDAPPVQEWVQERTNPKDGLKYVWIPPGSFQMGCSPGDSDCQRDEMPAHNVRISRGFYLGQTEVTQAAYLRVMGTNPSRFTGGNLPVEQVSQKDATKYCTSIGGRLPTEAEWEYAARGGIQSARYGTLDEIAWYSDNSRNTTHAVATKKPNAFGLYDMLGNVYEWTSDWLREYSSASQTDPKVPSSGTWQMMRGGGWEDIPAFVRSSYRYFSAPGGRKVSFGFRCLGEAQK